MRMELQQGVHYQILLSKNTTMSLSDEVIRQLRGGANTVNNKQVNKTYE